MQQICVNDKRVGESYLQELHAVKQRSQQALEAEDKRFKKLQLEVLFQFIIYVQTADSLQSFAY